jgi:hypothetical protein
MIDARLERENAIVLMVIQALCGVVTTNWKAVSLEFPGQDLRAHFLLRRDLPEDREEIEEEFPSEIAALTLGTIENGDILVKTIIHLVDEVGADLLPPGRMVLMVRN